VGTGTGLFTGSLSGTSGATTIGDAPTKLVSVIPLNLANLTSAVDPAVVDINTTLADGEGSAAGTGMVITSDGDILTNNHVVEDAVNIKVTIRGRGTYAATVVGVDVAKDVAVLKVTAVSGLTTVRLTSSSAAVGTAVAAVGNALGKGGMPAATEGRVVAVGRTITAEDEVGSSEVLTGLIESSASLEPGDSGGPLLDAAGEVVAMDTAAESTMSDAASQVGYAIPIENIVPIVDDLVAGRSAAGVVIGKTAFLGVETSSVSTNFGGFGDGRAAASTGVAVEAVVNGSPASEVGIEAGDDIVDFDGVAITSEAQLKALIIAKRPGTLASVTVSTERGNETLHLRLTSGPVA
jgi:S1-C subfamily serine protease